MDADWYEDPLSRFDGRFFDGRGWTAQVSTDGRLEIDPDFDAGPEQSEFTVDDETRAVAQVQSGQSRSATTSAESPVRTVAVLDEATLAQRLRKPPPSTAWASRPWLRWLVAAALIALAAVALTWWSDSDDSTGLRTLNDEQAARVEDIEASGTDREVDPVGATELEVDAPAQPDLDAATFDPGELIQVGALPVVNGASVLKDLAVWHRQAAVEREIDLGADAGCWFGQLSEVAERNVHCGPVGQTADAEPLFDSVPIVFQDVPGGQVAQPVVDAATFDGLLANGLLLIGDGETREPAEFGRGR